MSLGALIRDLRLGRRWSQAGLASRLCDASSRPCLTRDPVLRVNAAGVLAKLPGQQAAGRVAGVLGRDEETRRRYITAVLSRVCLLDWSTAARPAVNPLTLRPDKARFVASRLASEVLNPRDAGARWCSAAMLRDLSPIVH